MSKRETRAFGTIELRTVGGDRKIEGYAAVFNTPAIIADLFSEEIEPGAFRKAIVRDDVRALVDHDSGRILGRNRAGTLRLAEDSKGLHVEISPPDTQTARDLMVSMERGDVTQMSFNFSMYGGDGGVETWDLTGNMPTRSIDEVGELYDVSVVTFPAYPETSAAVRSLEARRAEMIVIPNRAPVIASRLRMAHGLRFPSSRQ